MSEFTGTMITMKKILYTILLATTLSTPALADQAADLKRAQTWLNGLDKATADFQQIDYNGGVMRGKFYIDRPGRLRFEYAQPTKDFIVADGFQIHFYDGDADQYNSAPIGTTLADFILRDNVSFTDPKIKVESVKENVYTTDITVSQADEPGMGYLTLKFDKDPYRLISWDIVDAQGLTTTIVLNDMNTNASINPSIFKVDNRNLNMWARFKRY